jgi:hypothetical protein
MSQELINQLRSFAGLDVVAIYDEQGIQVFRGARIRKASIKRDADLPDQPVENGVEIPDHIIYKPVEIELQTVLDPITYLSTYKNIEQAFLNAQLFTVQLKATRFDRMAISSLPHEEDPRFFNTLVVTLHFKQIPEVIPDFEDYVPEKKNDSNAVQRGGVADKKESTPEETKKASNAFLLYGKKAS